MHQMNPDKSAASHFLRIYVCITLPPRPRSIKWPCSHMPLYTFVTKMIRRKFGILTTVIIRLAVTCGLVEIHTQHKVCGFTYQSEADNVERWRTSKTITFCVTLLYNFNVRYCSPMLIAIKRRDWNTVKKIVLWTAVKHCSCSCVQ